MKNCFYTAHNPGDAAMQCAFDYHWSSAKHMVYNLAGIDIACLCAAAFTFERFQAALSVVLAYAAYLPSASCFVLLPLLSQVLCPMSCENSHVYTQK